MRFFVLTTLLAVASSAMAQESEQELVRREALNEFVNHTLNVARAMQLDGKVGIATTDDVLNDDPEMSMAIGKVPEDDELRKRVKYILYIRNGFLLDHPDGCLEHGATHEVCHAVLGHLEREDDDEGEEYEAEKCAYLFMGEDAYVAHLRAQALLKDGYEDFLLLDEQGQRNFVRRAFGYEELPPQ